MKTPAFWATHNSTSRRLEPLARLYAFVLRFKRKPTPIKLSVPVICVGNATAGGAGKTPAALAIGAMLKAQEKNPFFLSRGYGGSVKGPVRVGEGHSAAQVGDEPLLLARLLPTIVSSDRAEGAILALTQGAGAIIMDDGLQNDTLAKDVSFLVIDSHTGFGNGLLLPAGPLREPLEAAWRRASAAIIIGKGGNTPSIPAGLPVLAANLTPRAHNLAGKRVFAFCGIAYPQKFLATLEAMGAHIAGQRNFADHHPYTDADLAEVTLEAARLKARLVTTAKDAVKIPADTLQSISVIEVDLLFERPELLQSLLDTL